MKIEFYYTDSENVIRDTDDRYFVMNDRVYADNNYTTESQEPTVMFEDFIVEADNVSWRVVSDV